MKYVLKLMLLIYAVYLIQFAASSLLELRALSGMTYPQRVDRLDRDYYHNEFYGTYAWLNSVIPQDLSFSLYFEPSTADTYLRYERKFNYYLYPRKVLPGEKELLGYGDSFDGRLRGTADIGRIEYSGLVVTLKNDRIRFKSSGNLKFLDLNGRRYYLVAVRDNKGLLAGKSLIDKEIVKGSGWSALRSEFRKLYGREMSKAEI